MTTSEVRVSAQDRGVRSGTLVDTRWLAGHLGDPNLRVVELDVSPVAYDDSPEADRALDIGTTLSAKMVS